MPRLVSALILALAALPALAGERLRVAPDLYAPVETEQGDPARAAELLAEARAAVEAGEVSRALRLATDALAFDPHEPTCRRVLGYEQVDGRWLTAFQQKQTARGLVWDARFGWLKPDEQPRYVAGERRAGRRWITAEQDAARHASIDDGWRVRTDHFQVTTNHSLAAAAALAVELEQLHQLWQQLCAGYHLGADEVRGRFAGERKARVRTRPYNVVYHKTKQGYIAALRHKQPRIAETNGIYFDDLRQAHFFADRDGFARATLYHEAVHQLFQESQKTKRNVGRDHGFWAVEGVATYFESLTPTGEGTFTIGHADAGRLPAARVRAAEGVLVSFAELADLSMQQLQQRDNLPALYSQMAGVATFLMHADDAQRREPFVRYLRDLYAGRAKQGELWQTLGESPVEAQSAYRRWLQNLR